MNLLVLQVTDIGYIDGRAFLIVSGRGGTERKRAGIFLFHAHVFVDFFGKFPRANDQ